MQMRPSRVLEKLRGGGVASCVRMNLADPRIVEIAAMSGFDCVWIDMEHAPNTVREVEHQVRAAKVHGVDTMVRVERGSYSDLVRPLELDAAGVLIPHVMGPEDARAVARTTRFHPVGRRPLDGGNTDGGFCGIPLEDYIRQANERRFVAVQIEDPEAMEEIEETASVEGIDILFFGPGDFAHGLGAPGDFAHPRLLEAMRKIPEVARRHGKFAGTVAAPDRVREIIDLGYRLINVGADVLGLSDYFRRTAAAFDLDGDPEGAG